MKKTTKTTNVTATSSKCASLTASMKCTYASVDGGNVPYHCSAQTDVYACVCLSHHCRS